MNSRRPRLLLLTTGAVVVATVLVITLFVRSREPIYQGKPLSYWVDELSSRGSSWSEAKAVLSEAEPKAVDFLLQKLRSQARRRQKLAAWSRLPPDVQAYVSAPEPDDNFLQNKIPYALSVMGSWAIPQLLAATKDTNSDVQTVALRAFGMMGSQGEQALLSLIPLLAHTNGEVRLAAVFAVSQVGGQKPEVVHGLMAALNDSNRDPSGGTVFVRESAAMALGLVGPAAIAAVPALTGLLDDPEPYCRREVVLALWRIQKDTNLVERVIVELEKPQAIHTYKAFLETLGQFGPAAKPAIPAILRTMTNWGTDMSHVVRPVLLKIDPEAVSMLDKARK